MRISDWSSDVCSSDLDAAVVLMHMQGEPRTMQRAPAYAHAPSEVFQYLARRIDACMAAGIPLERIAVDPGIGFGKTVEHNLALIEALPMLDRQRTRLNSSH